MKQIEEACPPGQIYLLDPGKIFFTSASQILDSLRWI